MKAIAVKTWDEFEDAGPGTVYRMNETTVLAHCPGCGEKMVLDQRWAKSGTTDALTLSPSVVHDKAKGACGWHGWLQNGEWRSC